MKWKKYLPGISAETAIPPDRLLKETINEISTAVSLLKLFFPDVYDVFIFWFRGNMEWSFTTNRYNVAAY